MINPGDRIKGLEEAAKVADAYAETNMEMAGDSILLDLVLHGGGFTKADLKRSEELQLDGTIHSSMFHAAQNIAEAIRNLK